MYKKFVQMNSKNISDSFYMNGDFGGYLIFLMKDEDNLPISEWHYFLLFSTKFLTSDYNCAH